MVEMEELSPTPCENGGENRACARASRRSPDSPRGRDEDGRYELLVEFRDYLVTLKRSRATIAACDPGPPVSTTTAAARLNNGVHAGFV